MMKNTHRDLTSELLDVLVQHDPNVVTLLPPVSLIAEASRAVDDRPDVEMVLVKGDPLGLVGRDDPHDSGVQVPGVDDEPRWVYPDFGLNMNLTGVGCHYIDVRKGHGLFDDYDGYSFEYGSGKVGGSESVGVAAKDKLGVEIPGDWPLDHALAYWLNDEYVHAPGMQWYRPGKCSPAFEQYSRFADHAGVMPPMVSLEQECFFRFPLTEPTGAQGCGYPFSVFMPVDNMARYGFEQFVAKPADAAAHVHLGSVMHALQDGSTPHHAAGCHGNFHQYYEEQLELAFNVLRADGPRRQAFRDEMWNVAQTWWRNVDTQSVRHLTRSNCSLAPARNWRIDVLVTWLAFRALYEFEHTYGSFVAGRQFNEKSALRLAQLAGAAGIVAIWQMCGNPMLDVERVMWSSTGESTEWPLSTLGFGMVERGTTRYEAIQLTNTDAKRTLTFTSPTFELTTEAGPVPEQPFFLREPLAPLAAGKSCLVNVGYKPTLPGVHLVGSLVLRSDSALTPEVRVPLEGTCRPLMAMIEPVAPSHRFGTAKTGSFNVAFSSIGTAPLTITAIDTPKVAGFKVSIDKSLPITIPPGGTPLNVTITYKKVSGPFAIPAGMTYRVCVHSNATNGVATTITVTAGVGLGGRPDYVPDLAAPLQKEWKAVETRLADLSDTAKLQVREQLAEIERYLPSGVR